MVCYCYMYLFLFLIADDSSRILYPRPKSLLPEMMNADMDSMFFIFLFVCSWFCGCFWLNTATERTEKQYLEGLDLANLLTYILSSSRKN